MLFFFGAIQKCSFFLNLGTGRRMEATLRLGLFFAGISSQHKTHSLARRLFTGGVRFSSVPQYQLQGITSSLFFLCALPSSILGSSIQSDRLYGYTFTGSLCSPGTTANGDFFFCWRPPSQRILIRLFSRLSGFSCCQEARRVFHRKKKKKKGASVSSRAARI